MADAPAARSAFDRLIAFSGGASQPARERLNFDNADADGQVAELPGAALAGASLQHARLARANLSQADFTATSCGGIVFDDARLEQTVFRDADLAGASLRHADAGQACFAGALMEDACLAGARLRFADFSDAVMDGADASGADLWGANLARVVAHRARFADALLDEVKLAGADLSGADLSHAQLRRAQLPGAKLNGADLRHAVFAGADLSDADLSEAVLPHVVLTGCNLRHARFAGAWMERTRMRAHQLGGATGEEAAGEYAAAVESYIVLEQNFRSLGNAPDASWAFRRRRRMGKQLHRAEARAKLAAGEPAAGLVAAMRWLSDVAAEALCDYGESLTRILRALLFVLIGCAAIYWITGSLVPRHALGTGRLKAVDYLLFSLDSMTSVGTGEVDLRPAGQLGVLISSLQTVAGTILLGLFGFVLGVRMRN